MQTPTSAPVSQENFSCIKEDPLSATVLFHVGSCLCHWLILQPTLTFPPVGVQGFTTPSNYLARCVVISSDTSMVYGKNSRSSYHLISMYYA